MITFYFQSLLSVLAASLLPSSAMFCYPKFIYTSSSDPLHQLEHTHPPILRSSFLHTVQHAVRSCLRFLDLMAFSSFSSVMSFSNWNHLPPFPSPCVHHFSAVSFSCLPLIFLPVILTNLGNMGYNVNLSFSPTLPFFHCPVQLTQDHMNSPTTQLSFLHTQHCPNHWFLWLVKRTILFLESCDNHQDTLL